MRVGIEDIKNQIATAASKYVSEEEALYFTDLVVETHLRKAPRMNPLQEAVGDIEVWRHLDDTKVKTLIKKESVLLLDFNGLAPALKIKFIHDELEQRARKNGIAAVGFRNSSGIITLNPWVTGPAKRNLICIGMFNGGTECCVPYGAKRGVLGTNPLAYAVPTDADPIILDMATTEIPFFEVKQAKEKDQALPANAALGTNGNPTTIAAEALSDDGVANLLPMGAGFKGYGIVMLIEVLTGPLVQSLLSTEQTSGWNPTEYGCLILAIDIASFTDPAVFKSAVTEMCFHIRRLSPADGFDAVQVPGDRGHAKVNRCLSRGGIEIDAELIRRLKQLQA